MSAHELTKHERTGRCGVVAWKLPHAVVICVIDAWNSYELVRTLPACLNIGMYGERCRARLHQPVTQGKRLHGVSY